MMQLPDDITVVIAAKNEAATVADVVVACRPFAHDLLVVVDAATRDATAALAAQAGARVLVDRGKGKGHALRMSIPQITTSVTVFVDADGSHDAADIPRLVQPIFDGRADHVSASRLIGGSSELHGGFDEFFRLAGSSFITACVNHRFGVRLSDTQNGFRAIRTDVLRHLDLREDSTTIEQEMIIRSLGMGYRIAEVPSHEYERRAGTSHISVRRAALRYVTSMVRYLWWTRYPVPVPPAVEAAAIERRAPANR
jgi:glycosyltransferase involved in cell wall biosynthesis